MKYSSTHTANLGCLWLQWKQWKVCPGEGGTPYSALYGEASPEMDPHLRSPISFLFSRVTLFRSLHCVLVLRLVLIFRRKPLQNFDALCDDKRNFKHNANA